MRFRDMTIEQFGEALASKDPTPGGGCAAALAGVVAAALAAMVARTTAASKKFADRAERMDALAREADALRADFLALVEEDAAAFDAVMAAFRLPKETAEQQQTRSAAIQAAYHTAVNPPMKVCEAALRALDLARQVAEDGTPSAVSDAGVAALQAAAALEGAALNVRINLTSLKDDAVRRAFTDRVLRFEAQGRALSQHVQDLVRARLI